MITNLDNEYLMYKMIPDWRGGEHYIYRFPNGFGASVIRHEGSYGFEEGLYELGVTEWFSDADWHLTYDTEITNDVLGYLTEEEVLQVLMCIKELPEDHYFNWDEAEQANYMEDQND